MKKCKFFCLQIKTMWSLKKYYYYIIIIIIIIIIAIIICSCIHLFIYLFFYLLYYLLIYFVVLTCIRYNLTKDLLQFILHTFKISKTKYVNFIKEYILLIADSLFILLSHKTCSILFWSSHFKNYLIWTRQTKPCGKSLISSLDGRK